MTIEHSPASINSIEAEKTPVTTAREVFEAASAWYRAGLCVMPPEEDGTKAPAGKWKSFQSERPDSAQMRRWYGDGGARHGVGLLCGAISGNLEMFELEGRVANDAEFLLRIERVIAEAGLDELWERLHDGYHEFTPSGGLHLLYRIADHEAPSNTKIAQRPKDPKDYTDKDRATMERTPRAVIRETLIETRGEGGYVVVAPSQGPVHPTGNPWVIGYGCEAGRVPTITWAEREALVEALRVFDVPKPRRQQSEAPVKVPQVRLAGNMLRVGDDFNARGDWQVLLDHGWTHHHVEGHTQYWERPGGSTTGGHSATTGHDPTADRLWVFSSSTEFESETPLTRFHVYAVLEHNGDYRAATKALGAQGYGDQTPWPGKTKAPAGPSFHEMAMAAVPALSGFTEPDEPVEKVQAAFDAAPKGVTAPPVIPQGGRESFTDTGTANRFMRENQHRFLFVKGWDEWLYWDGVIWQADGTERLVADAIEALVDRLSDEAKQLIDSGDADRIAMGKDLNKYVRSARMNAGRKGLLATVAAKLAVMPSQLDTHTHLVGLLNGTLNVKTGKVTASRPEWLITKQLKAAYDPDAKAPRTQAYLEEVLPDPKLRDFVQRSLGYTMTGEQDQRAFFVVHGVRGTGKSQFVELFGKMFGTYATVAAPAAFHKKQGGKNGPSAELHALRGARFVFASESDEDFIFDPDLVKGICGGETLSSRTLYEKKLTNWRPECVVWLATNNFPRFPADEQAVWDRVKPVGFTKVFRRNTDERVFSIADVLFEAEASGILNLMIEWLLRYREHGLREPQEILDAIDSTIREVDPVAQFWDHITECGEMVAEVDAEVAFPLLYHHYRTWSLETLGLAPRGSSRFGRSLRALVEYGTRKSNGTVFMTGWKKMGYMGVMGSMWPSR